MSESFEDAEELFADGNDDDEILSLRMEEDLEEESLNAYSGRQKYIPMRLLRDLDRFFTSIYNYWRLGGIHCILLSRLFSLLSVVFVIIVTVSLTCFVDWTRIYGASRLSDAWEWDGIFKMRVVPFTILLLVLLIYGVFFAWSLFQLLNPFSVIELVEIYLFYTKILKIPLSMLSIVSWDQIVERLAVIQRETPFILTKETLTTDDICSRIGRKRNFYVALMKNNVIDLGWAGSVTGLTQSLEWNIEYAVSMFVFNSSNNEIRDELKVYDDFSGEIGSDETLDSLSSGLRWRFRQLAMLNVLLFPFVLLIAVVFYIFKYGEEFKSNPEILQTKQWSNEAKIRFYEYDQLPHMRQRKLKESIPYAVIYSQLFTSQTLILCGRFFSFVFGSISLLFVILSLYDDTILLNVEFLSHSLIWYVGIITVLLAASRGLIPDSTRHTDPSKALRRVAKVLGRAAPDNWIEGGDKLVVRDEFDTLFVSKIIVVLEETLGLFLNPLILFFILPRSAKRILVFIAENTVELDGIGDVYRYSKTLKDKSGSTLEESDDMMFEDILLQENN